MTPKTRVRQLAPAIGLAVLLLALGACGAYPNSTFNHHTDFNTDIDALWNKLLGWGTFVFIFVEGILIFTVIKFRKRPGGPPVQMTHGNTKLEITWTVLPIVILIIIAIPTVKTIFKTQAKAAAGSLEIEVIGPPVVVGVQVSAIRFRHRERVLHPDGPHGEFQAPLGGRDSLVLGAAARRQARRGDESHELHLVHAQRRSPVDGVERLLHRVLRIVAREHAHPCVHGDAGGIRELGGGTEVAGGVCGG